MRIVVWIACAGCWTASPRPASTPIAAATETTETSATQERGPGIRRSVWEGQYICSQGPTALRLALERNGDTVEATFEFGPLDPSSTVPHGAYRMTGTATPGHGGRTITLQPTAWLEQPPGYVMVGLHATSTRDHRRLVGRIDYPGCRTVDVARVDR